jgi:DNA helicase-2/ATP-dependent DNA helicase PcrA
MMGICGAEMKSWDEYLTGAQKRAASHKGSHARLLAGPGTGKTLTMTRRVLWLTFTRAAAAELRQCVKGSLDKSSGALPRVSTLHSFALRELVRNAQLTRLPKPIRIADDYEERWIIQEELKHLLGKDVDHIKGLLNALSADWQKLTTRWEERFPDPQFLGAWKEHREVYKYTLRSELVYQLKQALQEQGENMDLEGPPRYVMIDEYQDLNACDLAVIKSLATLGSEIYCAGDDDQSIYGFRFANPDGIRRFVDDYQPSEDIALDICQRCRENILKYGLYVAKQDPRRIDKAIKCKEQPEIGKVQVLRFPQQKDEAEGIAQLCYWLINDQQISPDEILILLRSDKDNKFSNPIKEALSKKNIPVGTISNPLEPLNSRPGRELLCLMRLTVNRADHLAWRTVLDLGDSGIGQQTFFKLYDMARREGITFSEVVQKVKVSPALIERTGNRVAEQANRVESIFSEIGVPEKGNLEEWLTAFAENIIRDEMERQEIVNLFLRVKEIAAVESLEDLLRTLNVSLGDAEQDKEKGKVAIMTMHQAKGLSADAVILAAAEDEYIPGRATGEAVDDERRLLYVSLTRARKHLYVTYCNRRTGQQKHSGRETGTEQRTFTNFLSGGPYSPEDGRSSLQSICQ